MNRRLIIKMFDKVSPIMSGIGAFLGVVIVGRAHFILYQWVMNMGYSAFYIYAGAIPALTAYLLCSCTHRKLWFYSPGALGGFIGALIGMSVGGLMFPLISEIGCLIFTPILATVFSYLFHKHYLGGKSR